MLGDRPLPWAVTVLGGSLLDSPVAELGLTRGGHLRVGLEDDPTGPPNVDVVRRAVGVIAACGRAVATTEEERAILGLPR